MMKKHKILNKKLWDTPEQLKQSVSDLLIAAVWDFIDFVRTKYGMDIRNADVIDIILYGSMANYFYNTKSDIDLGILLNTKSLEQQYPNLPILKQMKLYYYDWTMFHKTKIGKYDVNLSFKSVDLFECDDRYCTGPNYSVLNKKWLFKPIIISDKEWKQIKKEAYQIYKSFMRDYKKVKKNGFQIQDVRALFFKIIDDRHISVHTYYKQVITPVYIAYKESKKYLKKMQSAVLLKEENKFTLK